MALSREDQNTFLTIAVILIVCVISILAVFNIIWEIVQPPISTILNTINQELLKNRSVDYNFPVPEKAISEDTKESLSFEPEFIEEEIEEEILPNYIVKAKELNFNFLIPEKKDSFWEKELQFFPDAILSDLKFATKEITSIGEGSLKLIIPKIGIDSPIVQGSDAETLLKKGFWVYPGSYPLGKGEIVLLCHRRHWGPYHPSSCWYIDKLSQGDSIIVEYNFQPLMYTVVGTKIYEAEDPLIYTIANDQDYIKISACHPLGSNKQRFVVLAKRIKN